MAQTDGTNISAILISLGVDEKIAGSLQNNMNGVDYLNLVNAVTTDSPSAQSAAKAILQKYNIKLGVTEMNNTRLEVAYYEMHTGKKWIDESELTFVRPIAEMDSPVATMSGYSSFVRANSDDDAQAIMDWLEENEFDYQNNDSRTFLVQCSDRENTYRLNHFVGGRNGKTQMMDELSESDQTLVQNLKVSGFKGKFGDTITTNSTGPMTVFGAEPAGNKWNIIGTNEAGKVRRTSVEAANAGLEVDETVMEKKPGKQTQVPASSEFTRNPVAQAGRMKAGAGAHNSKDPRKRDAWDRAAKHKKSYVGEASFSQGETVRYGDREAPVHVPAGPGGTVGILVDGKIKMVQEQEVARVTEGFMGMTKIDPINRLAALAGIRTPNVVKEDEFDSAPDMGDDFDIAPDIDDPMGSDLGSDAMDPIGGSADAGLGDMDIDPAFDAAGDDFGNGNDLDDDGSDFDMPGGDIGGQLGGLGDVGPVDSEAYTMIQDHLNEIQDSLGDVKLSEYRSLIAKLDALTMQIKSMGRDYLGETRRKK